MFTVDKKNRTKSRPDPFTPNFRNLPLDPTYTLQVQEMFPGPVGFYCFTIRSPFY